MLITEGVGPVWVVTQDGHKTPVAKVPAVLAQGQGSMLGGAVWMLEAANPGGLFRVTPQ